MNSKFRLQQEIGLIGFDLEKVSYWKLHTTGELYLYFSGIEKPLKIAGAREEIERLSGFLQSTYHPLAPKRKEET